MNRKVFVGYGYYVLAASEKTSVSHNFMKNDIHALFVDIEISNHLAFVLSWYQFNLCNYGELAFFF